MKTTTLLIAAILSLPALATTETNWPLLVQEMKTIKVETVSLQNGDIRFEVAPLRDGSLRFLGFREYRNRSQAKLVINSSGKKLETLCEDSLIGSEKFKASLRVELAPVKEDLNFLLANGQQKTTSNLQNPFKTEKPSVSLVDGSRFPILVGPKYDFKTAEALLQLITEAIASSDGNTAVIDLEEHNGLACALATGAAQLVFESKITYEKGLPETMNWLDQKSFAELYTAFWEDRVKITSKVSDVEMKASELILLGWNASEKKISKESLLKNSSRVNNLYTALKHEKAGISDEDKRNLTMIQVKDHWKKTGEFGIPKKLTETAFVETFRGKLEVLEGN